MKKKKRPKDVRVVRKRVKFVVVMVNTNERFLETTFHLVGLEKRVMKEMDVKFGYSVVVFPKKNYIFKSISYLQPKPIRKALKQVHNLNFEFLPIENNVISMELNDIVRDLYVKNDVYVTQTLAEYLYKINLIFGRINDYVYRGSLSKKVIEIFLKNTWESEICDENVKNDFHLIREWANEEFTREGLDEMDEIEREFRLDGRGKVTNDKISESYLIPVPRDSKGKVVKEELANINHKQLPRNNRKRMTFFNKGRKSMSAQSNPFESNLTGTSGEASKPRAPLNLFDDERLKQLQEKFKVDLEIKEESNQDFPSSKEESFDSHSDSEEFDPNKKYFTNNSFDSVEFGFGFENLIDNFDLMIVMDRSNDLITPFVSQSSYMGLLDDLLKGGTNCSQTQPRFREGETVGGRGTRHRRGVVHSPVQASCALFQETGAHCRQFARVDHTQQYSQAVLSQSATQKQFLRLRWNRI